MKISPVALVREADTDANRELSTLAEGCSDRQHHLLAMRDAMELLGGKWTLPVMGALAFKGKLRFTDIIREVGIGAKMLSKELHLLESNQMLTRTVLQTKPISVEYELTPYGHTLGKVIREIVNWGTTHRQRIMKGTMSISPEVNRN